MNGCYIAEVVVSTDGVAIYAKAIACGCLELESNVTCGDRPLWKKVEDVVMWWAWGHTWKRDAHPSFRLRCEREGATDGGWVGDGCPAIGEGDRVEV